MVSALRQMCCPRDKSDEQKRLEQEMDAKQIEQMKQLSNPQVGDRDRVRVRG